MRRLTASVIAVAASLTLGTVVGPEQAAAGETGGKVKAVLELFTSQGCSSCPPADKLLVEYAKRSDVIALTLPVDYWDYLGWKDTFGSKQNSKRQKAYARARGDGMVYTPQIVINGRRHANGSARAAVDEAIAKTRPEFEKIGIPVRIYLDGGEVVIDAGIQSQAAAAPADKPKCTVWLAAVLPRGEVEVRRGENRGEHLIYANVVREFTPVGVWQGKQLTIRLDRRAVMGPDVASLAVIVQQDATGPILGAAMLQPPTN